MVRGIRYIANKLVCALLSSVILELCSLIQSVIQFPFSHYNSHPQNLWLTVLAFTLIFQASSVPVYILVGIPISMLIDSLTMWMKSTHWSRRYIIRFILYGISSILVMALYFQIMQSGTITYTVKPTITQIMTYGLPGLVFYHTWLLLKRVTVR